MRAKGVMKPPLSTIYRNCLPRGRRGGGGILTKGIFRHHNAHSVAYPPPPFFPAVPLRVQALAAHQRPRVPGHRVGLAHPAPHALARVRPAQDDTARLSLWGRRRWEERGGDGRGREFALRGS